MQLCKLWDQSLGERVLNSMPSFRSRLSTIAGVIASLGIWRLSQAVNSMFGGSLPHEGPPLRRGTAAARPPSGRRRAQEFAVYEDTGILASPGAAADKTQACITRQLDF